MSYNRSEVSLSFVRLGPPPFVNISNIFNIRLKLMPNKKGTDHILLEKVYVSYFLI